LCSPRALRLLSRECSVTEKTRSLRDSHIKLVAVLGPTATGKSALALAIAERFGGEIVNCDSTAVYRGFDVGTDKIATADRRGIAFLHRMLRRFDAASAARIQPRDLKRIVRALEVFFLTGRPLTAHFEETAPPIPDLDVLATALRLPAAQIAARVARRVDDQF